MQPPSQSLSDIEKVFEHICPSNTLTVESQYLLKALLDAQIIESHNINVLQLNIKEII